MAEVADDLPGIVAVREGKDLRGPVLTFTPGRWKSFIGGIKDGESADPTARPPRSV
ncbi:hypothetical protein GCM10010466_21390 [Planomonospora alba]|uniref:DUF397 domain-containing protein n=1 Tax=Planomonospora alba TaxID=161354 RepID=A0ABP6MYA7_9ACTN